MDLACIFQEPDLFTAAFARHFANQLEHFLRRFVSENARKRSIHCQQPPCAVTLIHADSRVLEHASIFLLGPAESFLRHPSFCHVLHSANRGNRPSVRIALDLGTPAQPFCLPCDFDSMLKVIRTRGQGRSPTALKRLLILVPRADRTQARQQIFCANAVAESTRWNRTANAIARTTRLRHVPMPISA